VKKTKISALALKRGKKRTIAPHKQAEKPKIRSFEEDVSLIKDGSIDAGLFLLRFFNRYGKGLSQAEIAYVCGCNPGRIGQIERAAIKKLRQRLKTSQIGCLFED